MIIWYFFMCSRTTVLYHFLWISATANIISIHVYIVSLLTFRFVLTLICTVCFDILNFSTKAKYGDEGEKFHYTLSLVFIQCIVNALFARIGKSLLYFSALLLLGVQSSIITCHRDLLFFKKFMCAVQCVHRHGFSCFKSHPKSLLLFIVAHSVNSKFDGMATGYWSCWIQNLLYFIDFDQGSRMAKWLRRLLSGQKVQSNQQEHTSSWSIFSLLVFFSFWGRGGGLPEYFSNHSLFFREHIFL